MWLARTAGGGLPGRLMSSSGARPDQQFTTTREKGTKMGAHYEAEVRDISVIQGEILLDLEITDRLTREMGFCYLVLKWDKVRYIVRCIVMDQDRQSLGERAQRVLF